MDILSDLRDKIVTYCDENPNALYSSGYDEVISDAQANMLLKGDFEGFDESIWEMVNAYDDYPEVWAYWEGEFASAFAFDSWADVPEPMQELARENRHHDESELVKDMIRHKRCNVTATILKPGAPEPENLIYAPGGYEDERDAKLARYLIDAFGVKLDAVKGHSKADQLRDKLEVIYGGYDREQLTLIGRVDLFAIYEAQKAPTHVTIGPEDVDHLLFYEHHNGCGNMGTLPLTRTRTMPAIFRVDGTYGYGVDSCYGFTGQHWNHEIRVATKAA